jgi:glutaminase
MAALALIVPSIVAQAPGDIQKAVDAAHAKFRTLKEGKNADYIPALAKVNPDLFGIAVVTADGKAYTAGDVKTEVSIQSISKVFTMAQVIQEQGVDSVEKRIGVDATGARFNSIIAIEAVRTVVGSGAPEMNPLVNPGAISATSMVQGKTSDEVWKKIIGFHNDAAGRSLNVLQDVYKSESDTNQRNQAIGALMLAYGYIKENWQQAVDLYTRQCSIGVNAQDLATSRYHPASSASPSCRRRWTTQATACGRSGQLRPFRMHLGATHTPRRRRSEAARQLRVVQFELTR